MILTLAVLCALASPAADRAEEARAAGRFDDAIRLFQTAIAEAPRGPDRAWLGARLGLTLTEQQQNVPAVVYLRDAVEALDAAGDPLRAASARRWLAWALTLQHHYGDALDLLAVARATFESARDPGELAATLVAIGHAELALGEVGSAYERYVAALELATDAGDAKREHTALASLVGVLRTAGLYEDAIWVSRQALELARVVGDTSGAAHLIAGRALSEMHMGHCEGVEPLLDAALEAAPQWAGLRSQAAATRARVRIQCGDPAGAMSVLDQAAREGWDRGFLANHFELDRGKAAAALGDRDGALRHLRPLIEGDEPESRRAALAHLGDLALSGGDTAEAERAFGLWLAETDRLVAEGGGLPFGGYLEMSDVRRVEHLARLRAARGDALGVLDAAGRLHARDLASGLLGDIVGRPLEGGVGLALDSAAVALERREVAPPAEVVRTLPADLAVLALLPLEGETLAVWIEGGRAAVFRQPTPSAEVAVRARAFLRRVARGEEGYEADAAWLAEHLLGPVRERLASTDASALAIEPHGVLAGLPFAALPFAGGPLVDRIPVFEAASLGALHILLRRTPDREADPMVIVADATRDLPGARRSAEALASSTPGARLIVGRAATERAVLRAVGEARRVHIAVHGRPATRFEPGRLMLADGPLRAHGIATTRLHGRPVVLLAACETGVGEAVPGGDVPGVLDRAFLQAGARSVISTLWRVDDDSAARFSQAFYGALESRSVVGALAFAQRVVRESGPEHAAVASVERGLIPRPPPAGPKRLDHPYHWAGFRLLGDHR